MSVLQLDLKCQKKRKEKKNKEIIHFDSLIVT